jgi:hypothetical protein
VFQVRINFVAGAFIMLRRIQVDELVSKITKSTVQSDYSMNSAICCDCRTRRWIGLNKASFTNFSHTAKAADLRCAAAVRNCAAKECRQELNSIAPSHLTGSCAQADNFIQEPSLQDDVYCGCNLMGDRQAMLLPLQPQNDDQADPPV